MQTMRTYANNTNNYEKILYKDLSYKINGILFHVHDKLGRYAREKQYGDLIEKLLKEKQISYEREKVISKTGEDINKADFIIEDSIVLELKVKLFIEREDYYQVLRYLECGNLKLGIIVNFRQKYLKLKRVINPKV